MAWEVEILGDPADLRTLAESPELSLTEGEAGFVMRCAIFEALTEAGAVREKAREIVASLSGAARLFLGTQHDIEVGKVTRIDGERRSIFAFMEVSTLRLRGHPPTLVVTGPDGTAVRSLPAAPVADAVNKASQSEAVQKVLRLRRAGDLQWVDITRILEVIQGDGGPINASENELDSLTGSANHPAVAGDLARHGATNRDPPPERKRMTLRQARSLIDRIIRDWLASK